MTPGPTPCVAVIGGGYAGMAAAVSLSENGIRSTLFEAGKTLGGRARRIEYRGQTLDNGQHILSGAYSELIRLMSLAGSSTSAIKRIPLTLSMPPEFGLQAPRWIAPFHLAWALLTARGLTVAERLSAAAFMRSLQRSGYAVEKTLTVASLLASHGQSAKLIRYLWEPLTVSALNTPLTTASAQVFVNVLRDTLAASREASDLLLPCTDLSELFPDAASRWLHSKGNEVRQGARIRSVAATSGQFELGGENGAHCHAPNGSTFDAVIVAIGPHQFDSITLPSGCAPAASFTYEPIVTIYLYFDTPVRLPQPMFGQAGRLVQWFFDRRALSKPAGDDSASDGLVAAVISASGPHEDLPNEVLAARVLAELSAHTGPLPQPSWHKVITEKFATFACTPLFQTMRPALTTPEPGLYLAGDYTAGDYPATLEGAVRSGVQAARLASDYLAQRSR